MHRFLIVLFLAAVFTPGVPSPQAIAAETATAGKTKLELSGMTCGSCKRKIESSLKSVDGVTGVSIKKNVAEVTHASGKVTPEHLVEAVKQAGYDARVL